KAAAIPEQDCEQATEQKAGNYVQEDVAQMITGRIRTPKKVIDHVGEVLDWPVMAGEGIEKEVVPEGFEDEQGTLNEWIVANEINIVPYGSALHRWQSDEETDRTEKKIARPLLGAQRDKAPNES